MKAARSSRQRGIALLALLVVLAIGASWFLVRQLNAESGGIAAVRKNRNVEVLNRAKQALIGYVAAQAAKAGENRPGALPCPEAAGDFNDPANEGTVSYPCTLPKVGRFPWRTLGLDKLVDASGEPLWYVVSPGWAGANTVINSNSPGQLALDGAANDAVALIIAPGPAFTVAAATGCNAWTQTRPTTGTPDWRNYLECGNATYPTPDATKFVTTGPSGSFNDQVVKITAAEILPAIEAAIANRIEREIAPQLKSVYASSAWGLSSSNPLFPYPAQFNNPDPGTSSYQGASAITGGLLPVTAASCTGDPRCSTTFVAWNTAITPTATASGGTVTSSTCSVTATVAQCTGTYEGVAGTNNVQLRLQATAANVAMALRQFNASMVTVTPAAAATPSGAFNSDGSARIFADALVSGQGIGTGVAFSISANIGLLADHALLDPSTASATGWFVRNQWYRLSYYAVAPGHTAAGLPAPSCASSLNCLSITNLAPAAAQRAILILAGRSLNGTARPSPTLGDYLEFGNATAAYERRAVSTSNTIAPAQRFNDRIVVIDSN